MSMIHYENGYGLRERPLECMGDRPVVKCPCCDGYGEHAFGAGMDADGKDCSVCGGNGELRGVRMEEKGESSR